MDETLYFLAHSHTPKMGAIHCLRRSKELFIAFESIRGRRAELMAKWG